MEDQPEIRKPEPMTAVSLLLNITRENVKPHKFLAGNLSGPDTKQSYYIVNTFLKTLINLHKLLLFL